MEILAVHASSLCACTHAPTVSQTDLTVLIWLSLSRILTFSKIRSWALEILAVHASSLCACTCTLAKYVAKTNLIVVVVILVVIFVVARQFERSTTILENWCHASNTYTDGGVYRVAPQLKIKIIFKIGQVIAIFPSETKFSR